MICLLAYLPSRIEVGSAHGGGYRGQIPLAHKAANWSGVVVSFSLVVRVIGIEHSSVAASQNRKGRVRCFLTHPKVRGIHAQNIQ
jgi:hypothetical protein